MNKKERIKQCFAHKKQLGQTAFVGFITAGDPNLAISQAIMNQMPDNGVDIIELGMPFSDPMADGPAIQDSSLRALQNHHNMHDTLEMVAQFRQHNDTTPIILMGYYNPVYVYGIDNFLQKCNQVGVDGLIIVDLPPEEDQELFTPAQEYGIDFIRLLAPTTDEQRLPHVLAKASGFVYYISVLGVTGKREIQIDDVAQKCQIIKKYTNLPICVGFGITNQTQARAVAQIADGYVVGSAIVREIAPFADNYRGQEDKVVKTILQKIKDCKI